MHSQRVAVVVASLFLPLRRCLALSPGVVAFDPSGLAWLISAQKKNHFVLFIVNR